MTPSRPHRARRALLATTLGIAALVPVGPTAQANGHELPGRGAVLLACAGTVSANYSPGLTLTPRAVSITSQAAVNCPLSTVPTHTSATFGGSSSGRLSCLLGPADGTLTFHWGGKGPHTGEAVFHGEGGKGGEHDRTSTAAIRSIAALRPNGNIVTVSTGRITDGAFKGATVVTEVTLLASQQTACLTPQGLASASGPTTVTITRL
ncbi:hypothetical protein LE181_06950 [Streptomyces sp. SCA3-4]|uniref:hypothetical protein n=1 Tax=Streptomyces sichuanensis TaxID=2871810 RepID=UPI001CE2FFC8|nr:hypothetical protein [Streptomyces sichuanensis]MCA6091901.1 hypothetical protein [Streptomyces sichuanensis]